MNAKQIRRDSKVSERDDSPFENLIIKILISETPEDFSEYVPCSPYKRPDRPYPSIRNLGIHERNLLGKMMDATLPVVCITGPMGCGKSTTLHFLYKYFLGKKTFHAEKKFPTKAVNRQRPASLLLAMLDFKDYVEETETEKDKNKIIEYIVDEMRARIKNLINDDIEFIEFWDFILEKYNLLDMDASIVGAKIQSNLDFDRDSNNKLQTRKTLYKELSKDLEWYLRYLILFWKYICDSNNGNSIFNKKRNPIQKSIIIFDNLDTLSPHLQRSIWDIVLRSAKKRGPTFVLLMRPETFDRLGNADKVFDKVPHHGPSPFMVLANRLEKFKSHPEKYFRSSLLDDEEKEIIMNFLLRHYDEIVKPNGLFSIFLNSIAGSSIRSGLNISQGIFMLKKNDLINPDLSIHFIIRECIKGGQPKFHWDVRSPIENPFFVYPAGANFILLKVRILKYLYNSFYESNNYSSLSVSYESDIPGRANARRLSEIRNDFVYWGYPEEIIKSALSQMMRKTAQLIVSNGHDLYELDWGDEEELVYLTDIGKGYITALIYDIDFVQEIMRDVRAQVEEIEFSQGDKLVDMMNNLHNFLRYLLDLDKKEMAILKKKNEIIWYTSRFGINTLSLEIIKKINQSVRNILAKSIEKYPHYSDYYQQLILKFENLVLMAEAESGNITSIKPSL